MGTTAKDEWAALKRELRLQMIVLVSLLGLMWSVEMVDLIAFGGTLDEHGIEPRTTEGLLGILFAPFLHVGLGHLLANTLPFFLLGWLVIARELRDFVVVTVATIVVAGLGVWALGAADSVHVGASAVVFGYLGYLLLIGWYDRSIGTILLSLLVLFFYGGMVFGVLPGQPGISWEGHLFGLLAGAGSARLIGRRRKKDDGGD